MRLAAHAQSAPLRSSFAGTLLVLTVGAVWGILTAPVLPRFTASTAVTMRATGLRFGPVVLGLTLLIGRAALALVSVVAFSTVFLAHGCVAAWLAWWGGESGPKDPPTFCARVSPRVRCPNLR